MCFQERNDCKQWEESYFDGGFARVISRQGFQAATARDTIKPQQINLSRGTLPNLNFHGRGPRSKIIRISRSEFANFASWRHQTFGVTPLFYRIKFRMWPTKSIVTWIYVIMIFKACKFQEWFNVAILLWQQIKGLLKIALIVN